MYNIARLFDVIFIVNLYEEDFLRGKKRTFEKRRNFIAFTRKKAYLVRIRKQESLISTCVCYNDAREVIAFELSRQRQ